MTALTDHLRMTSTDRGVRDVRVSTTQTGGILKWIAKRKEKLLRFEGGP